MSLLLYYILRRFFVKLSISEKEIRLEKGLLIKRAAVLPISAIVRITVRRTPLMRLFGAREICVFTLGGKVVFFLSRSEPLPLLPQSRRERFKPSFFETSFGAFVDTRALAGLFVFAAALRRVSALFGGEYFDRVVTALTNTANDLERALRFFHITIPKIAVTVGVFALGAWLFAFIRKLLRLARFRVFTETSKKSGFRVIVTSGYFTLYEHALVPNTAARFRSPTSCRRLGCGLRDIRVAVRVETLVSLVTRRAPLYLHGVMICPCVRRCMLPKILKNLCGFEKPKNRVTSPKRAFFGHILAPLIRLGVFAAALTASYRLDNSELLKIVLYSGVIVNLYAAALYLLFMSRSGIAFGGEFISVTARRGLRLYTAVFPRSACERFTITQSVFQKRSGLCHERLAIISAGSFTLKQLPKSECLRRIPF